jgi:hypothetical protein
MAYAAVVDGKMTVIVNGKAGKKHSGRGLVGVTFSPDGGRVACAIRGEDKWNIAIDGVTGKEYKNIITPAGRKVLFDSVDSFHYLVQEGNSIYLVEERIR